MSRGRSGRWWFSAALVCVLPVLATAYEQQIRELAGQMAERLTAAGRKNVAVVDFTDLQGNVTELGRFLAEEMSVQLAIAGKGFEVVDRTHLKAILQEHKLAATGIIDPQTARKLGQIAGVDTIVTGSITPFGESVRLALKVLNTTTAGMIAAATADIPKTKAIEELLGRGIGGVGAGAASGSGTPPAPVGPTATAAPVQTVGAGGFSFELQACERVGTSVTCSLTITNQRDDRRLSLLLHQRSRAFDDLGNEYTVSEAELANARAAGNYYSVEKVLISGVRTRASITFESVSLQARRFSVIEVVAHSDVDASVKFRNVLIN